VIKEKNWKAQFPTVSTEAGGGKKLLLSVDKLVSKQRGLQKGEKKKKKSAEKRWEPMSTTGSKKRKKKSLDIPCAERGGPGENWTGSSKDRGKQIEQRRFWG